MSDIQHMSVAMQQIVDLISMVMRKQQYRIPHNNGKKLRFLLGPPQVTLNLVTGSTKVSLD
jgi:hypothetical protein